MTTPHTQRTGSGHLRFRLAPDVALCIVSGGQTGVDRAALDVALELGLVCGGWCPRGRRAEDGRIPDSYPLTETESTDYAQRTEWNVRDSDGTLILTYGRLTGGTALTAQLAKQYERPLCIVDFDQPPSVTTVVEWFREQGIRVLNVAGPRESSRPGTAHRAREFLRSLMPALSAGVRKAGAERSDADAACGGCPTERRR